MIRQGWNMVNGWTGPYDITPDWNPLWEKSLAQRVSSSQLVLVDTDSNWHPLWENPMHPWSLGKLQDCQSTCIPSHVSKRVPTSMVPTESDRFPEILHLTLDGETPLSPYSGV